MSNFETALKLWWGPLSDEGPRHLPHFPHSESSYACKTSNAQNNISPCLNTDFRLAFG